MLAGFCSSCEGLRVAELGSGCGVVSLIIAARKRPSCVVAVEVQEELHRIAELNVAMNELGEVVECANVDHRVFAPMHCNSFDVIVSNPPFHPADAGRINPNSQRAIARHEMHGTLRDTLLSAKTLLAPGGRFAIVFASDRRNELLDLAKSAGLELLRIEDRETVFLAEFKKPFQAL
jgi:tRNA1Val (adenine37-N6)-methyltransferase